MTSWNLPPGVTARMVDEQFGSAECKVCRRSNDDSEFELEYTWVGGSQILMCDRCAAEYEDYQEYQAERMRELDSELEID